MAKSYSMVHSDCWTPLDAEGCCPRCGFIPDMQSIEGVVLKKPMGFPRDPRAQWCPVHGGWFVDSEKPCPECKERREAEG